MKIKSSPTNHMHRPVGRSAFFLIPLLLVCFALSPQARAVCQEGCDTNSNTFLGDDALLNNTGSENTAIGFNALINNTTGGANAATGIAALYSNTTGSANTASGWYALQFNTVGIQNTANGAAALSHTTTGSGNIALGYQAGQNLTTGSNNIDIGNKGGFERVQQNPHRYQRDSYQHLHRWHRRSDCRERRRRHYRRAWATGHGRLVRALQGSD